MTRTTSVLPFTPADWYWLNIDGRIYSSKRNALVYTYDTPYLSFVAKYGGSPPWPTDASGKQTAAALMAQLALYGIFPVPPISGP